MNLTRSLPRVLALLAGGLAAAGSAGAQVTGSFEAGSGAGRLGASNPTQILSVAPGVQLRGKYFRLDARGNYAEHADRGWQTSGLVTTTFQLPLTGALKAELAGSGAWSRLSWGRAAAGALAEARIQMSSSSRGLALSAGIGRAFPFGPSEGISQVEARTWSRMAGLDLGFSLRRTGVMAPGGSNGTRAGGGPPLGDSVTIGFGDSTRTARRLQDHYTDFNAILGWAHSNVEVEAGLGRRFGKPVNQYTSWRVQALYWLSERLALVASAGRFPMDVVSGLPSGSYAMLSMRISWNDRSLPSGVFLPHLASRRSSFEIRANGDGEVALAVWAPSAGRVEVMGSFSDWQPVELEGGEPGWWLVRLPLAAGLYEINVRFDGGPWQVPDGAATVADGFGGLVGVFTVSAEN